MRSADRTSNPASPISGPLQFAVHGVMYPIVASAPPRGIDRFRTVVAVSPSLLTVRRHVDLCLTDSGLCHRR
ncbi:hypothetical protein GCM10025792_16370 [Pseudonocardia tropica]